MLPRTSPSALGRIANGNLAHKANVRSITASAGLRCPRHHDNATDSAASVGGLVFSRKRSQVCLHHSSLIIVLIDELEAALQKLKPKRSFALWPDVASFWKASQKPHDDWIDFRRDLSATSIMASGAFFRWLVLFTPITFRANGLCSRASRPYQSIVSLCKKSTGDLALCPVHLELPRRRGFAG
jgi:hypothetical protein